MVSSARLWWASSAAPPTSRQGQHRSPTVACSQRHFSRPSLYKGGLAEPADVLQHCLTLFRRAHLPDILPYLACQPEQNSCIATVGDQQIQEKGPLAPLSGVLDVGARRVLPGHLLRRSHVLSTLNLGSTFQQRVALTACTGEESVFEWSLQQVAASGSSSSSSGSGSDAEGDAGEDSLLQGQYQHVLAQESCSAPSSSSSIASRDSMWVVASVRRDADCDAHLPTTPHPKAAPEAVVHAQLAALQRGDVFGASCFNIWRSHTSGFGLGIHYQLMRERLAQPPYDVLLHHGEAFLGAGALPSQRMMLQEVVVMAGGGSCANGGSSSSSGSLDREEHGRGTRGGGGRGAGAAGRSVRFLWRLGMQANGCWMVTGISIVDTF